MNKECKVKKVPKGVKDDPDGIKDDTKCIKENLIISSKVKKNTKDVKDDTKCIKENLIISSKDPEGVKENLIISSKDPKGVKDANILETGNAILKKYFGYNALKDEQQKIINTIITDKRDVSAVLATGFGKSICYQLPVLIAKKSVIVICPLIALMNEQCDFLKEKGIPVCIFNGDTPKKDREVNEYDLLKGNYKLIYMTPEYFVKSETFIKKLYNKNNLLMVCIDEAHAVSTWGLDFRPSYTKLGVIKEWVDVPILTLTATASTKVKDDIKSILKLDNPLELVGNFDRPNLFIKVLPRKDGKNIMEDLAPLLKKYKNDYIIIYCKTRDETEKVAEIINNYGISCFAYHAGLNTDVRNDTQQNFNVGIYKCIVATIAFGMGINIPNVRLVIHYNCPKNMESYYQEIGRAGRDGLPSECYLFYSNKDFLVNRYFLKSMTNLEYKTYQEEQIRNIEKYIYTTDCRRKHILKSFNQTLSSCSNCDNCLKSKTTTSNKKNYTKQTYLLLSLIKRINDKFGVGTVISVLLGKNKVKDYLKSFDEFNKGVVFGKEDWWKLFVRTLINNDLLIEKQVSGAYGSTIGLTSNGNELINSLKQTYDNIDAIKNDGGGGSINKCIFDCVGNDNNVKNNRIMIDAFLDVEPDAFSSIDPNDLYDLLHS
jgi:Werner syndrome ATP-dependent helicase